MRFLLIILSAFFLLVPCSYANDCVTQANLYYQQITKVAQNCSGRPADLQVYCDWYYRHVTVPLQDYITGFISAPDSYLCTTQCDIALSADVFKPTLDEIMQLQCPANSLGWLSEMNAYCKPFVSANNRFDCPTDLRPPS